MEDKRKKQDVGFDGKELLKKKRERGIWASGMFERKDLRNLVIGYGTRRESLPRPRAHCKAEDCVCPIHPVSALLSTV